MLQSLKMEVGNLLNAILHGKRRGYFEDSETGVIQCNGSEDLLTASVFERLSYLSDNTLECFYRSVLSLSGIQITDNSLSHMEKCAFWPSWYIGQRRIEPDCFCCFDDFDIIIEAKRWDNLQQQYFEQWNDELTAYGNLPTAKRRVIFFAVGGLDQVFLKNLESIRAKFCMLSSKMEVILVAQSWGGIWKVLKQAYSVCAPNEQRILTDIYNAIKFHGIKVDDPVWLADLAIIIQDQAYSIKLELGTAFSNAEQSGQNNWDNLRTFLPIEHKALTYFSNLKGDKNNG